MAKTKVIASGKKRAEIIPAEIFVPMWNTAASFAEALEKSGLTEKSLEQRVIGLRKRGVAMKQFPRKGGSRLDVAALNALVAKSTGAKLEDVVAQGKRFAKASAERIAKRAANAAPETPSTEGETAPATEAAAS